MARREIVAMAAWTMQFACGIEMQKALTKKLTIAPGAAPFAGFANTRRWGQRGHANRTDHYG